MSEHIKFNAGGQEIEVTPENATLYTYRKVGHAGLNLSMYDHIFIQRGEDDGYYLFLTGTPDDTKTATTTAMIENGYTCILNQEDVAQCDIRAFDNIIIKQAMTDTDHVPEGWA